MKKHHLIRVKPTQIPGKELINRMDFDALTSSPEFAAVMKNPLQLAELIENTVEAQATTREGVAGVCGPPSQSEGSNVESQTVLTPDDLLDDVVHEGQKKDTETETRNSSGREPSLMRDEKNSDMVIKKLQPSSLTHAGDSTVTRSDSSKSELVQPVRDKDSPPLNSPMVEGGRPTAHERTMSSTAVPLNLTMKPTEKRRSFQGTASEIVKRTLEISDKVKGNRATIQRAAKPPVQTTSEKTKVSFLEWAGSVAEAVTQDLKPGTDATPGAFPDDTEELYLADEPVSEPTSDSDESFVSVEQHAQIATPNIDMGGHTYSDIVSAIASLKTYMQSIESRVIRHERECSADLAALSHRAGGNWSASSHVTESKTIQGGHVSSSAAPQPMVPVSAGAPGGSLLTAQPSVETLIRVAMKDALTLPPRVVLVKAKSLVKDLQAASDAGDYSSLPLSTEQGVEIIRCPTLNAALHRVT